MMLDLYLKAYRSAPEQIPLHHSDDARPVSLHVTGIRQVIYSTCPSAIAAAKIDEQMRQKSTGGEVVLILPQPEQVRRSVLGQLAKIAGQKKWRCMTHK
jgi:hypothetical protein